MTDGRWLQRGDTFVAVGGCQLARDRKLELGRTLTWREHDFTVVGIMKKIQTQPDMIVIIPIDVERHILQQPNKISFVYALPLSGTRAEASALARRIQSAVDTVKVKTLEEELDATRQNLAPFNVITLSGAIIAAVVCGFAVINTMIMSVSERTREIGLKKAILANPYKSMQSQACLNRDAKELA